MNRRVKCLGSLLLIVVLLIGVSPSMDVFAQATPPSATPPASAENRSIAFYPEETGIGTFITVSVEPGNSTEFSVVLGNSGSIHQEIKTYAIPVESASNGGFAMAEQGTDKDEQTSWVDYPEQDFPLDPGDGLVLTGRISVPEGTAPGEYVTALAAQQAEPFAVEGSNTFNQVVRWSLPILIVVPGEMHGEYSVSDANLELRENVLVAEVGIQNIGSITVRPKGTALLIDASGNTIGVSQVELGSIYSGTDTVFYLAWENVTPSSSYSIEYSFSDERIESPVSGVISNLSVAGSENVESPELGLSQAAFTPLNEDEPPSMLQFDGVISNNAEPIENARVSIVTYQDGEEVDRYPIMQAVTIQTGETPVEARYSLPGGFTDGTYTFEVTIELGSGDTQSILLTQDIDYEVVVGD